jgi:hypothetical protein
VPSDRKNSETSTSAGLPGALEPYTGVICSGVLGLGIILVLLFLFFPWIDEGMIARHRAAIADRERKEKAIDNDVEEEIRVKRLDEPDAKAKRQRRDEERKHWEDDRSRMEQDIKYEQLRNEASQVLYRWGMLLGFICLAFAAMGYLHFGQTTAARIFGLILLSGELLFVLLSFLFPHFGR